LDLFVSAMTVFYASNRCGIYSKELIDELHTID